MLDMKTVKPNPRDYWAVQFTGKNSKEVATWINQVATANNDGVSTKLAVARGSYITVENQNYEGFIKMRKNFWVVLDPEGDFNVYTPESFALVFASPKK